MTKNLLMTLPNIFGPNFFRFSNFFFQINQEEKLNISHVCIFLMFVVVQIDPRDKKVFYSICSGKSRTIQVTAFRVIFTLTSFYLTVGFDGIL